MFFPFSIVIIKIIFPHKENKGKEKGKKENLFEQNENEWRMRIFIVDPQILRIYNKFTWNCFVGFSNGGAWLRDSLYSDWV